MIRKERTRLFLIISILLMTGKSVNILANNRFVTNTYPIPYQHLVLASPIKGDVNNDKRVDISDVVAVINTIAGNPTFRATADVNGDNKVDISDIVAIINIIANGVQVESDPAVEAGLCPDEHHPHIINLGSAGLWSCCNVGATAPWEYGGYYAWGETFQKDYYDVKGYVNQESFLSLGDNIAGTENDVAHVIMGDGWQMPSYYNHIQNLSNHCSREWITLNGVPGRQYIASNGNSIFLPAAGYWSGYEKKKLNEEGLYMSADRNKNYGCLTISNFSGADILSADDFGKGMSVRAVAVPPSLTDPAVEAGLCPDAHHPHVIDMGSAGKWACCNVGGSYPWEVGNFYAWGETEPKQYYETENYIHCDGSSETYHNIGADIAGTDYDVAHVKWGSSWRMPTGEQIQALTNNCSEKWTQIYGVEGMRYTSPEGGSIFFPAAGYRIWGLIYQPKECNYWSSTLCEWGNEYSNTLECSEEEAGDVSTMTREWGILVRPVWK